MDEQAFFEQAQRDLASQPWQGPPGVRLQTLGTLTPGRRTIVATRSAGGAWRLTLDTETLSGGDRTHAQITLAKSEGEELDRMLANPCLYTEPALVGRDFPVTWGRTGVCWDGVNTALSVNLAGRRRAAVQICEHYGLTGQLAGLLNRPFVRVGV
jgi:hypothetical protein